MEDITITRALVELKTLQSRIDKAMAGCCFITYAVRGEEKQTVTPDRLQKIRDLMDYRNRLKAAIVTANANTVVKINADEYTVAEAIDRKNSIDNEKKLLQEMRRQFASVTQRVENHNTQVDRGLEQLLKTEFSKDNVKSNVENIQTISESYLKVNRATIVDPLKLEKTIERMEESITNFEKEVDLVLSESNATTRIIVAPSKKKSLS